MKHRNPQSCDIAPSTLRASADAWASLFDLRVAWLVCLVYVLLAVSLQAQNVNRQLSAHKPAGTSAVAPLDISVGQRSNIQILRGGAMQVYDPSSNPTTDANAANNWNGVGLAAGTTLYRGNAAAIVFPATLWMGTVVNITAAGTALNPQIVPQTPTGSSNSVNMEYRFVNSEDCFTVQVTPTFAAGNVFPVKLYHLKDTYLPGGDSGPAYTVPASGAALGGTMTGSDGQFTLVGVSGYSQAAQSYVLHFTTGKISLEAACEPKCTL